MKEEPKHAARKSKKIWVGGVLLALALAVAAAIVFWPRSAGGQGEPFYDDGVDRVMIDPGHGGDSNPGCVYGDVLERDINLAISLKLRDILKTRGYTVDMTREDNTEISLGDRPALANERSCDVFVSVHQNAVENNDTTSGIETWYNEETNPYSKRLAQNIQDALIDATDANDRGICPDTTLAVTRLSLMASCLVETGFLSSTEERALLSDGAHQQKLAEAIADGIDAYFASVR